MTLLLVVAPTAGADPCVPVDGQPSIGCPPPAPPISAPPTSDGGVVRGKTDAFAGLVAEDAFVGEDAYRGSALDAISAIRVGTLRESFDWKWIEPEPGRYTFAFHDAWVLAAARRGIGILPVLFDPPAFRAGAGAGRGTAPPRNYADLGRFGAALVNRYGPEGSLWAEHPDVPKVPIRAWQIWNEPNVKAYWPTGPNPAQYTQLLKATAPLIRQADPGAEIVTAGMPNSKASVPLQRFVAGMYQAGARGSFDTLAVNAYSRRSSGVLSLLEQIRAVMKRAGDSSSSLRITELGWSDAGPHSRYRVGAAGQAAQVATTIKALGSRRRHGLLGGWEGLTRRAPVRR